MFIKASLAPFLSAALIQGSLPAARVSFPGRFEYHLWSRKLLVRRGLRRSDQANFISRE